MHFRNTQCCGVGEISGLNTRPTDMTKSLHHELSRERVGWGTPSKKAFYLITDTAGDNSRGEKWVAFLKKNDLGKIFGTPAKKNPNSANSIKAWLLSPDEKKLKAWATTYEKQAKIRKAKADIIKARKLLADSEKIVAEEAKDKKKKK